MTDLLPPYHKPMTSELDCDLANDRVAALEAELERVKTGVVQCHIYRLPVIAIDVETGEQGVHWVDGYGTAEVLAVVHDYVPAPVYESIPKAVSEAWEQAEAEVALRDRMLRDIIERIALTPERWNGWTTEEVLADLRARAEKEIDHALD